MKSFIIRYQNLVWYEAVLSGETEEEVQKRFMEGDQPESLHEIDSSLQEIESIKEDK